MRAHRRNLGGPASSSLGPPNSLRKHGTAVSSSLDSLSATSSKRRRDCSGGGLTPPRPLASPTPSPPHSCGGKGWDINNPCEACIANAWSEQVGSGAQTQPAANSDGPFMSRSASGAVCLPCQDPGDSSPFAAAPGGWEPSGPLRPLLPCRLLHPQGKERLELESPGSLQGVLTSGA